MPKNPIFSQALSLRSPRLHRPGLRRHFSPGPTSKGCHTSQGFRQTTGWHLPLSEHQPGPPPRRCGWMYALAFLLLGGYLLFAHGCHGDEDNELFAALDSFVGQPAYRRHAFRCTQISA